MAHAVTIARLQDAGLAVSSQAAQRRAATHPGTIYGQYGHRYSRTLASGRKPGRSDATGICVLRADQFISSVEDFVSAALLGDGWDDALSKLASAAGARGAALMRCRDYKLVGILKSAEIGELVDAYVAGRVPSNSRQVRASRSSVDGYREKEFRLDHDDYTDAEMARDPYYQEFLRPNGFFWHANVRLDGTPDEEVALSFKRGLKSGPYAREDALVLNAELPRLRGAVRIARSVLDAEGAGVARLLQRRGAPVFELDAFSRVTRTHVFDEDAASPVRVVRGRLVARDRLAQPALDGAIARAVAPSGSAAVVPLPDAEGDRRFLQVVPVGGRARDVFRATAAVAVLIDRKPRQQAIFDHDAICDGFMLTDREADVALLLGSGLSPADIAKHLHIQVDTARDHLKSIFEKTDTNRQAELVALLARLRP